MRFEPTSLPGVFLVIPDLVADERGSFTRVFCRAEFAKHGLQLEVAQSSLSFNRLRGTLRGLHFQSAPHEEAKLVQCIRGRIYDVVVDARPGSPTRLQHVAFELAAHDVRQIFVPRGFAHGFQTLEDDTEVLYHISTPHVPEAARGFHHASPAIGIRWPLPVSVLSERDRLLERLGE